MKIGRMILLVLTFFSTFPEMGKSAQTGFNELISMSHLMYIGQWNSAYRNICHTGQNCPENAPTMYQGVANSLIYNVQINGRTNTFRDILTLKVIEPSQGQFPLDSEIASVLKMYQARNVELTLAFGRPLPEWIPWDNSSVCPNSAAAPSMTVLGNSIGYFLARMRYWYNLDPTWMANKLKIEPLNEFNNAWNDPCLAAALDKQVVSTLAYYSTKVNEVISSSIVHVDSVDQWPYVDWYWKYYGFYGSSAQLPVPNVHLYPVPQLDGGSLGNTIARFETVVSALRNYTHPSHRVIIGEIGYSQITPGDSSAASSYNHSQFLSAVAASSTLNGADRIYHWRLLSNWTPVTDSNIGFEVGFGYINYLNNTPEPQMTQSYLPYGFWWSH